MLPKVIAYSFRTTTDGAIVEGDTSVVVNDRTVFPTIGAGETFYAVLTDDPYYQSDDAKYETVKVTAVSAGAGDAGTLTIVRNEESSTGAAQAWGDATTIAAVITAKLFGDIDTIKLNANGGVITSYTETVLSTSGTGNVTFNLANANVFEHTVSADTATTFKVTGQKAQALSITVMVHQHEDGPSIIWDFDNGSEAGDILWPGDAIPDIDDDVTAIFTFVTIDSGVTWYGHLVGQDYGDGVA